MNSEEQTNGDYEDKFLTILNNKAKYGDGHKDRRTNGFVVLVRGDLKLIQSLCLKQKYNSVLTAHYLIPQDFFLGTLFAAFIFEQLRSSEILKTGMRIVLFGEIGDISEDTSLAKDVWEQAKDNIFQKLHERFGLVLSGLPKDFHLPMQHRTHRK